jgi:transposase
MELAHRCHDISDRLWEVIKPHLLGHKGTWGGNARDNRLFINAVFWIFIIETTWL